MDYPIRITNLDLIQDQNDGLFRLLFNSRNVINNKGDRGRIIKVWEYILN